MRNQDPFCSGHTRCGDKGGSDDVEHNSLQSARHVRLSAIAAGVPTPLPRRARLCFVSGECPLAGRLQMSGVRW
jgi:hypothetical protein